MNRLLILVCIALIINIFLFAGDDLLDSELFEMTFEQLLEQEITTAGKKSQKVRDIPASVVIITRQDIELYGYQNLREIIENVPGFYTIDQYAHTDVTLGVRGFWSSSTKGVLIFVNGISQFQDVYAHYPLNKVGVPVEIIERIEVVRGPMSVMYGSGAFYGAINIITRPEKDRKRSTVSVGSGTGKYGKVMFNHIDSGNKDYFSMTGSYKASNGPDVSWKEFSGSEYMQSGRSGDFFESSDYYFNLQSRKGSYYGDFTVIRNNKPWVFLGIDKEHPNTKLSDFANARAGYIGHFGNLELNCKVGYYMTNIQSSNTFAHDHETEPHLDFSHWALGSQAIELEAYGSYQPISGLSLILGSYYRQLLQRYELLNMPSIPYNDVSIYQPYGTNLHHYAVYTQADYSFGDYLSAVAGVRLEKSGDGKNIWELGYGHDSTYVEEPYIRWDIELPASKVQVIPRFALIYSPGTNNVVKFLYGKAIRMPAYHENNDVRESGYKKLEPERINTLELNLISGVIPGLTVNTSIYRNWLENLIYRHEWMEGDTYLTRTSNSGKMNTNGAEITISSSFSDKFHADVSLAYQKTEDEMNKNRTLMCSPELLGYFKAAYNFGSGITMAVSGNYVSKMKAQWNVRKVNPDGSYGGRYGDDSPAYLNLGCNISIAELPFLKGGSVGLRVSNILDSEIRYPTYSHSAWAEKGTLGPERAIILNFKYTF